MFLIYDNNEDRAYIHQAHHNLDQIWELRTIILADFPGPLNNGFIQ